MRLFDDSHQFFLIQVALLTGCFANEVSFVRLEIEQKNLQYLCFHSPYDDDFVNNYFMQGDMYSCCYGNPVHLFTFSKLPLSLNSPSWSVKLHILGSSQNPTRSHKNYYYYFFAHMM